MTKDQELRLTQAALTLLCAIMVWRYGSSLEATEFSGGRVTGPLLNMKEIGALSFVLAFLLAVRFRRVAAAITVVASLLCLPLYLYFAAPGIFRRFFRGDYSVPPQASFVWDTWTAAGILILAIVVCFSLRTLLMPASSKPRNSP
jgi:hypothetical protein